MSFIIVFPLFFPPQNKRKTNGALSFVLLLKMVYIKKKRKEKKRQKSVLKSCKVCLSLCLNMRPVCGDWISGETDVSFQHFVPSGATC